MKRAWVWTTWWMLVLLGAPALAPADEQEGKDKPPAKQAPSDAERAIAALAGVRDAKQLVWAGSVARSRLGADLGPAMRMVGGAAEPFEGAIEARVTPTERLLVSRSLIPGFGLLWQGSRTITRATTARQSIDLRELRGDLRFLLDRKRVLAAAQRTPWKRVNGSPQRLVADLDRSAVPAATGLHPMMARAETRLVRLRLTLSTSGTLIRMGLEIRRTDPIQAIMGVRRGAGPAGENKGKDEDGLLATTYVLERRSGDGSVRLQRVHKELMRDLRAHDGDAR